MTTTLKVEPKTRVVEIDPAMAKRMLERNTDNRPLKMAQVEFYAQQMRDGKWKFTGEPISYSNKRLVNGQHRLQAIIASDTTQPFLVIEGLEDDVFDVMDTGKNRSASDVLANYGLKSYTALAAISSFVIRFQKNNSLSGAGTSGRKRITNQEVLKFALANHEALKESVRIGYHYDASVLSRSVIGGLHFIFAQKNKKQADEFFTKLRTGCDPKTDNQIHTLRNTFYQNAMSNKKYTANTKVILTIKAWNAFRDKQEVRRYSIGPKESMPEVR